MAPAEFYSRWGNPTVRSLENAICELESAQAALAVASGMAAVSTAIMSNLRSGDHVVAGRALYGEVPVLLGDILGRFGVTFTLADPTDPEHFAAAIRPETRVLYAESPANPVMSLIDIPAVAKIAADRGIVSILDNTFATPFNQRPLALGFTAVVHSSTKYLGGHSDLTGGVIAGSTEFVERAWNHYRVFGPVPSPHDAWLVSRGLKTLGLRVERHNANTLDVARFLERHPQVRSVHYPGLESHHQHDLARRQMTGFGGMLSFELEGGLDAGKRFIDALQIILRAVSLGGVDSLISHPASMTHSFLTNAERLAAGIPDGLIRLSVGCEDVTDIIGDLRQALDHAANGRASG